MIQDIRPHRLRNEYQLRTAAREDSLILCFREDQILAGSGASFPRLADFPGVSQENLTYLFRLDQHPCFWLDADLPEPPAGFSFRGVREFRGEPEAGKHMVFAAWTALQLVRWYRDNRFCGRCGAQTFHDSRERAIRCSCGRLIYPRIVPAVIVGVRNGDRLLVTKYRSGFAPFALIAGFTEIGETLEETVAREVMEETGLRVRNIRYYKSQPWGIVDDLLAGFYCDVDGDDTITMDSSELKTAEWRTRETIELQPDDYSLTNEMMKRFRDGLDREDPAGPGTVPEDQGPSRQGGNTDG